MSTKAACLTSIGIALGALLIGLGLVFAFVDINAPGAQARAGAIGQGMAFLCLVPLAVIWLMWANRVRRERERR